MPRKSQIDTDALIKKSLEIIDECGWQELTINALARKLNIQPPSLYNHVSSLEELLKMVFLEISRDIYSVLVFATDKSKNKEAIIAFAVAYREYALMFPERYKFTSFFPVNRLDTYPSFLIQLRDFYAEIIKENFDISEPDIRCVVRAFRSCVHGFVMFELTGGWTKVVDANRSFQMSLELILNGLEFSQENGFKNNL